VEKGVIEKVPEIFGQKTTIHEYETKMRELERLIRQKEVEISFLKTSWPGPHQRGEGRTCGRL